MEPEHSTLRELRSGSGRDAIAYEYDTETPASLAVIHAICALTDVDPVEAPAELGFVLHDHVDPTALDTLLADGSGDGDLVLAFEITNGHTYAVEIADDGRIEVSASESE